METKEARAGDREHQVTGESRAGGQGRHTEALPPRQPDFVITIPRPPSLNKILAMERRHWLIAARAKNDYADSVRWSIAAHFATRTAPVLPLRNKIHVEITIFGRWGNKPDRGNYEKWIGDALGGFVMVDDGDEFWTNRITFARGKPSARLEIYVLDELVPVHRKVRKRIPHRPSRSRITLRDLERGQRRFQSLTRASGRSGKEGGMK